MRPLLRADEQWGRGAGPPPLRYAAGPEAAAYTAAGHVLPPAAFVLSCPGGATAAAAHYTRSSGMATTRKVDPGWLPLPIVGAVQALAVSPDAKTVLAFGNASGVSVMAAWNRTAFVWQQESAGNSLASLGLPGGAVRVVPPVARELACGEVGVGAMAEVGDIIAALRAELAGGGAREEDDAAGGIAALAAMGVRHPAAGSAGAGAGGGGCSDHRPAATV